MIPANPQALFIAVNLIGGVLVLGSYAIGLGFFPEHRNDLWGGVQGTWRMTFLISMFLATAGYLIFCYFVVFKDGAQLWGVDSILGPHSISLITVVFLVSASIWMPTTISYLHTGNAAWWFLTVGALWTTAISLLTLTTMVSFSNVEPIAVLTRVSCTAGLFLITAHCLVMDALIWVLLFHKS